MVAVSLPGLAVEVATFPARKIRVGLGRRVARKVYQAVGRVREHLRKWRRGFRRESRELRQAGALSGGPGKLQGNQNSGAQVRAAGRLTEERNISGVRRARSKQGLGGSTKQGYSIDKTREGCGRRVFGRVKAGASATAHAPRTRLEELESSGRQAPSRSWRD